MSARSGNKLAAAFLALLLALPPQARAQQSIAGGLVQINSLPGLPLLVSGGGTGATTAMLGRDNLFSGLIQRSVLDFGAKCDVINVASGSYSIPAGSTTLTLTSGTFSSIGTAKRAVLPGHGTAGASLVTTIAPTSTTTATLGSASVPGTINEFFISAATSNAGTGGTPAPNDTVTLTGGTLAVAGGANAMLTIKRTKVTVATVAAGGAGGTNGTQTVYGTTGSGNRFVASVTVAGGAITAVLSITDGGHYTGNPTTPTAEPVAGSMPGITAPAGATLNLTMRPDLVQVTTPGLYTNGGVPANPVAMGSSSGSLTGATFTMVPAFNNGGFAYGTDDSAAVQTALNPSTWVTAQGGPQQGATVSVPGSNCGLFSTVTVSGQSTRLVGTQPGKILFQATNNPQGSAFQWLGAAGGKAFSWAAPNGSTVPAGYGNGISGIAIECGTPNGSNQKYAIPLGDIGMEMLSQSNGDWGPAYFEACGDKDIFINAIASGSGVQDSIHNYVHDIDFTHPLDWDGVGIYHTGNSIGNGDYTDFRRLHGNYKNRPLLYLAALDNSRVTSLHFVQRPSPATGWYGLDIAGSIYGSTDIQPPQDSTAVMSNISTSSIMRGVESAASPPTGVTILGFDTTNSTPKTVLQPGHGVIQWIDENGAMGGSNGAFAFGGGADGILSPAAVFAESASGASTCRTNAGLYGGSGSSYFCNASQAAFWQVDNLSGNRAFMRWNGTNFLFDIQAGTGGFAFAKAVSSTLGGAANYTSLWQSGGASQFMDFQFGRTASDGEIGIAGAAAQFSTSSAQGDMIVRATTGTLRLNQGGGADALTISGTVATAPNSFNVANLDSGTGAARLLFSGTTQAIRIFTTAGTSASIEATDNTGIASFQPLKIGGLSIALQASQVTKLDYGVTNAGAWTLATHIVTKGYTVAGLPTGITGAVAYVTDAVACTFLAAPTGGSNVVCPVFYDGTSWKGG